VMNDDVEDVGCRKTRRAHRFPVSVKGVLLCEGRALLLENERAEWELPGGRLGPGESPEQCLAREILEETRLEGSPEELLDVWVYALPSEERVLIVTYGCSEVPPTVAALARVSEEHRELGWFAMDAIERLRIPEGYRGSIRKWLAERS